MSTREQILSVTAKILADEGVDSVSIREVCARAGVKAPTVYYYFQDKEGLIHEVVAMAYRDYIALHHRAVRKSSPLKALVKSWNVFFEFVENNTELYHAIVLAHVRQKIPPEGLELFLSIVELFRKLEEEKKLKLDAYTAAHIFYSTSYGLALAYVAQNKPSRLKRNIAITRDICIRGLLKAGK